MLPRAALAARARGLGKGDWSPEVVWSWAALVF